MLLTHRAPYKNVVLASISGIPGVGKSTAIRELQQSMMLPLRLYEMFVSTGRDIVVRYVLERSDEWKRKGYLDAFYANTHDRALSFQLQVFHSHVQSVQEALSDHGQDGKIIVCLVERSVWDQLLFWTQQERSKDFMDNDTYMLDWNMKSQLIPPVAKIFFFQTKEINTTMKRVKRREELGPMTERQEMTSSVASNDDDDGEIVQEAGGLKLDYQERLAKLHQEWFTAPVSKHGVPCVHVNADTPYNKDYSALEQLATMVADELRPMIDELINVK